MSFNSAFLSPSKSAAQIERESQQELAEERAHDARTYYKVANALIVGAMILVAIPVSLLAPWFFNIIGGVSVMVTSLALLMMGKGTIWNGVLSLIFGWIVLPGWFLAAPAVIDFSHAQYKLVEKQWKEKVLSR